MHPAHPTWVFLVREFRAEACRVRELAGVGAAAHREGLGVLAGNLAVGIEQCLDLGRIGLDQERLLRMGAHEFGAVLARQHRQTGFQFLFADGGGIAAIDALAKMPFLKQDLAGNQGKGSEVRIAGLQAYALPRRACHYLRLKFEEIALFAGQGRELEQMLDQKPDGVDAALGR